MKTLIELCDELAAEAHAGQCRFDGTPYIAHPRRVASMLNGEWRKAVALLHDVLEDSPAMTEVLRGMADNRAIPPVVMDAVLAITKRSGEEYSTYLKRVGDNELAREVKIADMLDNLADQPSARQVRRYAKGLAFLLRLEPVPATGAAEEGRQ